MVKRIAVFLAVGLVLCFNIGVLHVSANMIYGEDSTDYVPLVPFSSIICDSVGNYNVSFGCPWSSIYVPETVGGGSTSFGYIEFVSSSLYGRLDGQMTSSVEDMILDVDSLAFSGGNTRFAFLADAFVLDVNGISKARSARIMCQNGGITGRVTYNVEYLVYNSNTSSWNNVSQSYSYPFDGTSISVPLMPNSTALPIVRTLGDYYVINKYEVVFDVDSGSFRDSVWSLNDIPIIEASENITFEDVLMVPAVSEPAETGDLFTWFIDPLEKFFSISLLPGVTLGGICITIFAIPAVVILLKLFAGG